MDKVETFKDEFHFLSNFHPAPMTYAGIQWKTSEAAYQAMKTLDPNQRLNIAMLEKPGEAKRYGSILTLRHDWDIEMKLAYMEDIVSEKFKQNPFLKARLLATDDLELIEGNTWGDTFWGVCKGVGDNHLGKILMKVRDELR